MSSVWTPPQHIRPHVQGIFLRGDHVLLGTVMEKGKLIGYRAPGGGIDFCELAADALCRECLEELAQPVKVLRQIGISENIYTFNGARGHEFIMFLLAEFKDKAVYEQDKIRFVEEGHEGEYFYWLNPDELEKPIFPANFQEILKEARK